MYIAILAVLIALISCIDSNPTNKLMTIELELPKYSNADHADIDKPLYDVGNKTSNTSGKQIENFSKLEKFVSINKAHLLTYNHNKSEVEAILKSVYLNATHRKLNKRLVLAIVETESGFNPNAMSKGNYGLGQINLRSHKVNKRQLLDINYNISYMTKYLGDLKHRSKNDKQLVNLYNSNSLNRSDPEYVNKIIKRMNNFKDV